MKHLSIFLFNFLLATAVFSQTQTGYQVIIRVIDADTDKPVQGALVSLKEKGWQTEKADANGKVVFKDVMSRDVNFTVTAEGYLRAEENKNVAEQQESNTFEVKLKKPSAERVLIVGEVTDQNGKDVEGATVEFKLVNILKEAKTDVSGNYMIEIDLNELKVSSSEGELEVKKGDCKVKEKILVNQKVISKDIKLDCQKKPAQLVKVPEKPTEGTAAPTGDLGHVCFKNLLPTTQLEGQYKIEFKFFKYTDNVYKSVVTILPQEEKCFYNLKPGVYSYTGSYWYNIADFNGPRTINGQLSGQVLIESGKTKTIELKG